MGQYGNQPDFGTRAGRAEALGNAVSQPEETQPLKSAALYIGTGGTLVCNVVGGNYHEEGTPKTTIFRNIPNGTFFPVIVDNVWRDDKFGNSTTCSDIVALY